MCGGGGSRKTNRKSWRLSKEALKDRSRISQTEEAQATVGGISYEKKTKDTASERRVTATINRRKEWGFRKQMIQEGS